MKAALTLFINQQDQWAILVFEAFAKVNRFSQSPLDILDLLVAAPCLPLVVRC